MGLPDYRFEGLGFRLAATIDVQQALAAKRAVGTQGHGFFNRSPWLQRTLHRTDEFLTELEYPDGPPTLELP